MSITHDVMVSYAMEDSDAATEIRDMLEGRGFQCWMAPRDVRAGEDYEQEIVSAVENTRSVVVVFSGHANMSRHVHREIVLADNESKTVFPLRIENVSPTGRMKFQLTNRQRIDYFDNRDRAIETIHLRLVALGAHPKKLGSDGIVKSVPPPKSVDVIPETSGDGLRHFLPPVLDPLYLLFDWRGRIGRRSFFFGGFFLLFVTVAIPFLLALTLVGPSFWVGGLAEFNDQVGKVVGEMSAFLIFGVLAVLLVLLMFGAFSLWTKRLHDLDRSAWWILVPVMAAFVLPVVLNVLTDKDAFSIGVVSFGETQRGSLRGIFIIDWEGVVAALLFTLWLLFWPGRSANNKFGFAPSFNRDWKPYEVSQMRASARSEFDIPFVILSVGGRVGVKGMALGMILVFWTISFGLDIYYGIADYVMNKSSELGPLSASSSIDFQGLLNILFSTEIFRRALPLWGTVMFWVLLSTCLVVFAVVEFSCVLTKRLHDVGLSGRLLTLAPFAYLLVYAITALMHLSAGPEGAAAVALGFVAVGTGVLFVLPGRKDFNVYGPPPGFRAAVLRIPGSGRA